MGATVVEAPPSSFPSVQAIVTEYGDAIEAAIPVLCGHCGAATNFIGGRTSVCSFTVQFPTGYNLALAAGADQDSNAAYLCLCVRVSPQRPFHPQTRPPSINRHRRRTLTLTQTQGLKSVATPAHNPTKHHRQTLR
jgi:hypothetical protein